MQRLKQAEPDLDLEATIVPTPIGELRVSGTSVGLCEIRFPTKRLAHDQPEVESPTHDVLKLTVEQLHAYFRGDLREFDVPLQPTGTEFQQRVWTELQRIPYGETTSYGEIAKQIGAPTASRAVGAANGRNPIPIIIPCHRVIGRDGSLTGFGGGIETKRHLLAHERAHRLEKPSGRNEFCLPENK